MQRLFDIKRTQLEMVRDRGYDITPEEVILTMTLEQYVHYVNEQLPQNGGSVRAALSRSYLSIQTYDGIKRAMLVYYGSSQKKKNEPGKKVSIDVARQFINLIQRYAIYDAILIADGPLGSKAATELNKITRQKWQVFDESDLTYNPTKHVDTPYHELLSPKEAQAKLREMRTDVSKLLLIKTTDPIVRYYGWPRGGLVRIHRDDSAVSILAPKSINYRIIVEPYVPKKQPPPEGE